MHRKIHLLKTKIKDKTVKKKNESTKVEVVKYIKIDNVCLDLEYQINIQFHK